MTNKKGTATLISMFKKMAELLNDPILGRTESVAYAIYIYERLSRLPSTGTLEEIREIAILHQEWFNSCIPILEATRYSTASIPISGTEELKVLSQKVENARFWEVVATIDDFTRRWDNATSKISDTLKEKMEVAHA